MPVAPFRCLSQERICGSTPEHGFAFEGKTYRSLSAVAKAVTGSHCSGHFFFGLTTKGQDQ